MFADDTRQSSPSRLGLGPLVGIGGFCIDTRDVAFLEGRLEQICEKAGLPRGESFKWSPPKGSAFRELLKGDERLHFFKRVLEVAELAEAVGIVVISDEEAPPISYRSRSAEIDVATLFLERVNTRAAYQEGHAAVVVSRPSGGRKDEKRYLAECMKVVETGTEYCDLERLPLGVLTAESKFHRVLQLADVIASCSMARVAGEAQYSPAVFESVRPILAASGGRIGGSGLKLWPSSETTNLYHWILGDTYTMEAGIRMGLPVEGRPFFERQPDCVEVEV